MIDQPTSNSNFEMHHEWIDWDHLHPETIALSPEQIDQAVQLSQNVPEIQQWQTYLNALALFGVEEWLTGWASDLVLNDADCSLFQSQVQSQTHDLMNAVCNLQVGQFKLCVVTVGSFTDKVIYFPRAIIDLPLFVPHFYVLTEVLEEQMQVQVSGYLCGEHLTERQQFNPLPVNSDNTYTIPSDWFVFDTDQLLADLRLLLPNSSSCVKSSPESSLSHPQPQISSHVSSSSSTPHPLINTALWLRDQLDTFAQELSWVLMPVFIPAMGMRNVNVAIAQELVAQGVVAIPEEAGELTRI